MKYLTACPMIFHIFPFSGCGNYGLVGTRGGHVFRYNMQSGQPRGSYPQSATPAPKAVKNLANVIKTDSIAKISAKGFSSKQIGDEPSLVYLPRGNVAKYCKGTFIHSFQKKPTTCHVLSIHFASACRVTWPRVGRATYYITALASCGRGSRSGGTIWSQRCVAGSLWSRFGRGGGCRESYHGVCGGGRLLGVLGVQGKEGEWRRGRGIGGVEAGAGERLGNFFVVGWLAS